MTRSLYGKFLQSGKWHMDSIAMGRHFLPIMEKLTTKLPQLKCAVLCSADGFNICSIGLDEIQVGKMAALVSSLFSLGGATLRAVDAVAQPEEMDHVTLQYGELQLVCTRIPKATGSLILMACARAPLGVVIVAVQGVAQDIVKRF
jgi:predicted regulator of Ras-like GTPase activity (Roadblock/LC7/MglB family)